MSPYPPFLTIPTHWKTHGEIHRSNLRAGARVEGEQAWRAQAQNSHLAIKLVGPVVTVRC